MIYLTLHAAIYSAAFLILLVPAGNFFCRLLLEKSNLNLTGGGAITADSKKSEAEAQAYAGRIIGALERTIISFGIISNSWELMIAVIALKTITRYSELDEKINAEYFLVGSLFSIFWAILISVLWKIYDRFLGAGIADLLLSVSSG